MQKIFGLAFGILFSTISAQAQDAADCTAPVTQSDMNSCSFQDFQKADAELNAVWDDAKTNAENIDDTGEQSKALLTAQRGWLAFRDAQCELEGLGAAGGSLQPLLISSCKSRMTRDRTKQLQDFIEGSNN